MKEDLTKYPIVHGFLQQVAGEYAPALIRICQKKTKVSDEFIAKKIKLRVTETRTILNRLHYRGIADYGKKKNPKTGWYYYTWKIKPGRIIEIITEMQKEEVEKLEKKKELESTYEYYACQKNCYPQPFEIAAEYQFKCQMCGGIMNKLQTDKRVQEIEKQIKEIRKQIKEITKTGTSKGIEKIGKTKTKPEKIHKKKQKNIKNN